MKKKSLLDSYALLGYLKKVLSNTFAEVIEAAEIKAQYPISFADAFATATAIRMDAELLTGNPEFRRVEQLVKIRWL